MDFARLRCMVCCCCAFAAVLSAFSAPTVGLKGIAEVPPSASAKYVMNAGAAGKFVFDNFGEFYTDRYYSDEYAEKILRRAADPDAFVPIEIKLATAI